MSTSTSASSKLKLAVTSAVVAGIVTCLHHLGYFADIEMRWFDIMARWLRPQPSGEVVLVGITDEDFSHPELFGYSSPLNPLTVHDLLLRVAVHRPSVIVVDVVLDPVPYEPSDRSARRQALYEDLLQRVRNEGERWILVQGDDPLIENTIEPRVLTAWQALRREQSTHLTWASAALHAESGVVRHALRAAAEDTAPTLLGAAKGPDSPANPDEHGEMLIRYTARFSLEHPSVFGISAGDLLRTRAPTGPTLLTGKTVVVGGVHRAGRDHHWTPLGEMAGVQIWAEAIDTAVRGDSPRSLPWLLEWAVETVAGFAGGLVMGRFHPLLGSALVSLGLGSLTLLFSWLSFGAGFVLVNCLPSFFAVQLHQRIDQWREKRATHRRLEDLETQLRAARESP